MLSSKVLKVIILEISVLVDFETPVVAVVIESVV